MIIIKQLGKFSLCIGNNHQKGFIYIYFTVNPVESVEEVGIWWLMNGLDLIGMLGEKDDDDDDAIRKQKYSPMDCMHLWVCPRLT